MEQELKVHDKDVVVPGDVIAVGMQYLPSFGTYRLGDAIVANRLGLVTIDGRVIKTIPLAGKYIPQRNDVIIGRVMDILLTGWRIDINSPYTGVLGLKDATFEFVAKGDDLTRFYNLDDWVVAKIINVTTQYLIDLTMKGPGLRKLHGGQIIEVSTHKVPRIIGKKGSMVWMIKEATACRITVGQNGVVWIEGEPEQEIIAIETIRKIEDESHIPGLTERIKAFLEAKTGKRIPDKPVLPAAGGYAGDFGFAPGQDQGFSRDFGGPREGREPREFGPPRDRDDRRFSRDGPGPRGFGGRDRGFGGRGPPRGGMRPRFGDRMDRGMDRGDGPGRFNQAGPNQMYPPGEGPSQQPGNGADQPGPGAHAPRHPDRNDRKDGQRQAGEGNNNQEGSNFAPDPAWPTPDQE